jgi:NAD(P)-dependent dehydrogenase (short-subunit alcohol dehydrogenase family)
VEQTILGTAALALGCDVRRGGARALLCQPTGGPIDDRPPARADREYLVLGGAKHIGNVPYGVSKAATDKMTADTAIELRPHGVAVVSLYPGLVTTEKVMQAAAWLDLSNSESPEFIGRSVAALAADPDVMRRSGAVRVAADLAIEYGFVDIDGKAPRPLTLAEV